MILEGPQHPPIPHSYRHRDPSTPAVNEQFTIFGTLTALSTLLSDQQIIIIHQDP